jgi:predicted GNAT family acetyltransferase
MEKVDVTEIELVDNSEMRQFELRVEGHLVKIEYNKAPGKVYLTHTEVPKALQGKGIGNSMVKMVLDHIKSNNLRLVPLCKFVVAYIKKNSEYRELIEKGINI